MTIDISSRFWSQWKDETTDTTGERFETLDTIGLLYIYPNTANVFYLFLFRDNNFLYTNE